MHYLTPETKSSTHYWYSISNDYAQDDEMYFKHLEPHIDAGFMEDKWAVEHMQNLLDNDHINFKEMIIAGDKAGLKFRRTILNWAIEEYGDELANVLTLIFFGSTMTAD
jgi:vanillate O-demethylase monooxygenase subunit